MFYHLDTVFFPITSNLIAYYEDAFSESSQKLIQDLDCQKIKLSYDDAINFAANSIVLGNHIVVHKGASNFINIL